MSCNILGFASSSKNCVSCLTADNQTSGWESLGSITAVNGNGESDLFILYVKTIGLKEHYKVGEQLKKTGGVDYYYNVTLGNYVVGGKKYNAKFTKFYTTYYFNI